QALDCVAYATNGSVRDLASVRQIGFQFFASGVSVSHAFVHLVDFDRPVTIGGLEVQSGDVIYGDRHGLLAVPPALVGDIPRVVTRMLEQQSRIVDFCRSGGFSLDTLRTLVRQLE